MLKNMVLSSIKYAVYNVKAAFTGKQLLKAGCQCHVGGDDKGRAVCVHTLPILYQLTMFLDDGLAKIILVAVLSSSKYHFVSVLDFFGALMLVIIIHFLWGILIPSSKSQLLTVQGVFLQ